MERERERLIDWWGEGEILRNWVVKFWKCGESSVVWQATDREEPQFEPKGSQLTELPFAWGRSVFVL